MVYSNKFVAVVKCNGKILREHDSSVNLPFGSEYSILLKNMESRKTKFKIQIDGKDLGQSFILDPNSEMEIERFVSDLNKGNKLKFIEKTKKISDYRGDKIDDGFIRIEFQYEKQPDVVINKTIIENHQHIDTWSYPYQTYYPTYIRTPHTPPHTPPHYPIVTCENSVNYSSEPLTGNANCNTEISFCSDINNEGITVPGSESTQQFHYGHIGLLEEVSHTIVLRLRGVDPITNNKINKPITTKTKIVCSTCGKKSKSHIKFCPECGTSLI